MFKHALNLLTLDGRLGTLVLYCYIKIYCTSEIGVQLSAACVMPLGMYGT